MEVGGGGRHVTSPEAAEALERLKRSTRTLKRLKVEGGAPQSRLSGLSGGTRTDGRMDPTRRHCRGLSFELARAAHPMLAVSETRSWRTRRSRQALPDIRASCSAGGGDAYEHWSRASLQRGRAQRSDESHRARDLSLQQHTRRLVRCAQHLRERLKSRRRPRQRCSSGANSWLTENDG